MDSQLSTRMGGNLDQAAFRHFAPLLAASQRYACHSGCRFRSGSFDGIPRHGDASQTSMEVGPARDRDSAPYLAAKIQAAPVVDEFAARLCAGEPGLVEEMEHAHAIVMSESVRNAMMSMFRALDMFPPAPPPPGIDIDDCGYEDVSAPLAVIAQRLYNDEARRVCDTTGGPARLEHRALTAAFIIDFAVAAGVKLPPMSETQQSMLTEFADRASEFEKEKPNSEQPQHAREAFLRALGAGTAGQLLITDTQQWMAEHWHSLAWTTMSTVAMGTAAVVSLVLSTSSTRGRLRYSTVR